MARLAASWVGWAKTKLLVDQATSTEEDPTPIYMLDEVVTALAGSDSRAGVDAVLGRLSHRSPIVKQKALKLMTHIARRGSPELRRLVARQSGPVRELLHYRCAPDPFKGDTVWKKVQENAQEALNAIHGAPEVAGGGGTIGSLGGRIQGFGSDAPGGSCSVGGGGSMLGFGSDSSGGSGARMVGFGSADVLQSGIQAVSSGVRSLSGKSGGLLRQDGYSSTHFDSGSGYSSSASSRLAPVSGQPIMQAGAPALANPAATASAASNGGSSGQRGSSAGGAVADGAEQRLVDRICTPAGLRAAPGREDLQAFVDGISGLDGPVLAQLLERKMEAGPWQSTLRALCAIEAVVESGSSATCGQLAVHFQTHPEALRRAAGSPQASVRQRANKLLAMLGEDSGGETSAAADAANEQRQQQQLFTEDLLGEAAPSGTAPAASSAAAASLEDLLGEPASASPSSAGMASAPAAADLLAGLHVDAGPAAAHPPAYPVAAQPAAADPFGGMVLASPQPSGAAAMAQQWQPAVAPPPTAGPSSIDFCGGLSDAVSGPATAPRQSPVPATLPAPAAQVGDLLGGLSLVQGTAHSQLPNAPPAAGGLAMHPMMQQQPPLQALASMAAPAAAQHSVGIGAHMGLGPFAQHTELFTTQQAAPLGQHPGAQQPSFLGSHSQTGFGLAALQLGGLGGVAAAMHTRPGRLDSGSSGGTQHTHPGRQPSLNGGTLSPLGSSGIIDSSRDSTFNFVDDAIAAARLKK